MTYSKHLPLCKNNYYIDLLFAVKIESIPDKDLHQHMILLHPGVPIQIKTLILLLDLQKIDLIIQIDLFLLVVREVD